MIQPDELTVEDVWGWEGRSYPEVAAELGMDRGALQRRAMDLGFSRTPGGGHSAAGTYQEGPCVICRRPCDRDELDEDLQCPDCAGDDHAGAYHIHRWGSRPPVGDHSHPDWIVLEKLASDLRKARDERRAEELKPIRFELEDEEDPA